MEKLYKLLIEILLIFISYSVIDAIRYNKATSIFYIIIFFAILIIFIVGDISFNLDSISKKITFNAWSLSLVILLLIIILEVSIDQRWLYILFILYLIFIIVWAFLMDQKYSKKS